MTSRAESEQAAGVVEAYGGVTPAAAVRVLEAVSQGLGATLGEMAA
ncbi:hypothetical protein [Streptomyces echinatus]